MLWWCGHCCFLDGLVNDWGVLCGWSTRGFKFICVEITAIYSGMFYQVYMEILSLSEQTYNDRLRILFFACISFSAPAVVSSFLLSWHPSVQLCRFVAIKYFCLPNSNDAYIKV